MNRILLCAVIVLGLGCTKPGLLPNGSDGGSLPEDAGKILPVQGWNPKVEIGTPRNSFNIDIYDVDVDLNESNTGIAAWSEVGDTSGSAWVAWYRGGTWSAATRLSDPSTATSGARVALNDADQAVIAWSVRHYDSSGGIPSETVWARIWKNGAWESAVRLCAEPSTPFTLYASGPRVGIDAQGRALVVWNQSNGMGTFPTVYANRFDGSAWSGPSAMSNGTRVASNADVAVADNGSAAVVWIQNTNLYDPGQSGGGPSIPNVWARMFDGSTWAAPARIGTDLANYEGTERVQVTADATGRAFVVWEEHRTAENRIVTARYTPGGTGWSVPEFVSTSAASTDHLSFPFIATDGNGQALAVWQEENPLDSKWLGGSARLSGSSWSEQLFETSDEVSEVRSALDGTGTGWALYTRNGELKARKHAPAAGWATETSALGRGTVTDAAANSSGTVIVGSIWDYLAPSTPAFMRSACANVHLP